MTLTATYTKTVVLTDTFTPVQTDTPTEIHTVTQLTPTNTNTLPPGTSTPTPGDIIEIVTATPALIYPNPNPIPGTTPDRVVDYTVNRPISRSVFRIYTVMGRLIRKAEDTTVHVQGKWSFNVDGGYFQGLARGVYYYVIIVKDQATGKEAKSPIGKFIVQ